MLVIIAQPCDAAAWAIEQQAVQISMIQDMAVQAVHGMARV
jgi:hypothetical protein